MQSVRADPAEPTVNRQVRADQWFLTAAERGNPHTRLDSRHANGLAWSEGNHVVPLVHGAAYFRDLLAGVQAMVAGDRLMFTDWRGDPDERLDGPGTEVGPVFAAAARRGVHVSGLIWRSHLDRFQFSASENRHLGEEIEAAGGQCLRDMRVRPMGSHHQKLVVLRHPQEPERDVAYLGGIDLCHGRRDSERHDGDPQGQPMARVYGARPPWHDIQLAIRGPAVGDAETVFRERWEDRSPLSKNPIHLVGDWLHREDRTARPLPPQPADPPPLGTQAVQLLRTYPARHGGYPFAPDGERSVAYGYQKAIDNARSFIYLEDQYLWSADVAQVFADALVSQPELRMIAVIPRFPDQDGRTALPPNLCGREPVLQLLRSAGGQRFALYSPENTSGTPIYVHAKACIVDDTWACVGSDNANLRSWTHDSELSCAVLDGDSHTPEPWARRLRAQLAREHLGADLSAAALADPIATFDAFAESAARLDRWHETGQVGPRPAGQLRRYEQPAMSLITRLWAGPLYRLLYDPDGRSRDKRRAHSF